MPTEQSQSHQPVFEIMMSTLLAQALRVAVEWGIPDLFVQRPMTVPELAEQLGLDSRALGQVMRALTGFGTFTTGDDGRLSLTAMGETLCAGHPSAAQDLVLMETGPMAWRAKARMCDTVVTGRSGVELEFGKPAFQMLGDDPEKGAAFDRMMLAFHGAEPAAVARAYDFSGVDTLVDVGGGIGTMARAILGAYPEIKGTVFDQPPVIERAQRQPGDPAIRDRCDFAAGNVFESVPAGADVYLLSHILHDWSDANCGRILATCRDAMSQTSRLLIVEMVLPDGDEPHPGKVLDLAMMSMTGGQERTAAEYEALLARAGLQLASITPTSTPSSVIEAR